METKFTQGPWSFEYDGNSMFLEIDAYRGDDVFTVCEIETWIDEPDNSEVLANANLIAAAPDLYDALEKLMSWQVTHVNEWHNSAYDNAVRALAKARGESV